MITSKHPQLDHAQAWSCTRVTADTGVTSVPPVACLKPTGSNVVTLLDALMYTRVVGNVYYNTCTRSMKCGQGDGRRTVVWLNISVI